MDLGEIENVKAVVFESPVDPIYCYVCGVGDMDYLEWLNFKEELRPYEDAKRATAVNLDGVEKRFFLVWVQDCMDPPMAIVRADHEADAIDWFVDVLSWAHLDEVDLKDYIVEKAVDGKDPVYSDNLGFGSSGQMYDNESLMVKEITGNITVIRG